MDIDFFIYQAISDVAAIGNYYNAGKDYPVNSDGTVTVDDKLIAIYSIEGISSENWYVLPGKIVFKTVPDTPTVHVFGAYVQVDDECDIYVYEYQEKAIAFRAAYLYASVNPQRYQAILPYIKEQQYMYCKSAASNAWHVDFVKNKKSLARVVNRFIFPN